MRIKAGEPILLDDGTELDTSVKLGVFDAAGQQLPLVQGYDTETEEVEMVIQLADPVKTDDGMRCKVILTPEMKPFIAKFKIPGSYVMGENGKIIK